MRPFEKLTEMLGLDVRTYVIDPSIASHIRTFFARLETLQVAGSNLIGRVFCLV